MFLLILNPESLAHRLPLLFDSFEEVQYYIYSSNLPKGLPFCVFDLGNDADYYMLPNTALNGKVSDSQKSETVLPLFSV